MRRSPRSQHPIQDSVTWAVRGILVLLGSFILWEVRSVQQMHEDIATIKVIVDSHSHQIEDIWRRFRTK
jgi:hypothetical protein